MNNSNHNTGRNARNEPGKPANAPAMSATTRSHSGDLPGAERARSAGDGGNSGRAGNAASEADASAASRAESSAQTERGIPFEFHGTVGEYFRIWFVNSWLTFFTLGIFSFWATARTRRYFYGNTRLDGAAFAYRATGLMILKRHLVIVFLGLLSAFLLVLFWGGGLIPGKVAFLIGGTLLLLVIPLGISRWLAFNARMSSYRDVQFSFRGFGGKPYLYLPLLLVLAVLLTGMVLNGPELFFKVSIFNLAMITVFIIPLAIALWLHVQKLLYAYYYDNHYFGRAKFTAVLPTGEYLLFHLNALGHRMLIRVFSFGAYFAWVILVFVWPGKELAESNIEIFIITKSVLLLVAGIWVKAYLKTRLRNYTYSQLRLGDAADGGPIRLSSQLEVGRLFVIYISNLVLIVCTAGLAYPWARVRLARYYASVTKVLCHPKDLKSFVAKQPQQPARDG